MLQELAQPILLYLKIDTLSKHLLMTSSTAAMQATGWRQSLYFSNVRHCI